MEDFKIFLALWLPIFVQLFSKKNKSWAEKIIKTTEQKFRSNLQFTAGKRGDNMVLKKFFNWLDNLGRRKPEDPEKILQIVAEIEAQLAEKKRELAAEEERKKQNGEG